MHVSRNSLFAALAGIAMATTLPACASGSNFDTVDVQSEKSLASFEKVYIAPVSVALDPETRRSVRDIRSDRPVSEQDQERQARELHEDLTRAFGQSFEIAEQPGPGVLTVDTTITRLVSTRPTIADASNTPGISFDSLYAGGADYDVTLRENGTVLAEIADARQTSLNDQRPRVGVWQDADRTHSEFSRQLARYVSKN